MQVCVAFTIQHRHALATLQLVAVRKCACVLRPCALSTDGCRVPAYVFVKATQTRAHNSVTLRVGFAKFVYILRRCICVRFMGAVRTV